MNGTTYFYFHTDQWRYEKLEADALLASTAQGNYKGHNLADYNVVSQRLGWLPSAPHFNKILWILLKMQKLRVQQMKKAYLII